MRIVNIIQRYPPAIGGAETWCQEVCRYLARRGHEVRVLTLNVYHEEEYWRDPLDDEWTTAFGRMAFDQGVMVLPALSSHSSPVALGVQTSARPDFIVPCIRTPFGRAIRKNVARDALGRCGVSAYLAAFAQSDCVFCGQAVRKKIVIVPHFHPTHPSYERGIFYWLMRKCDVVVTVTDFEAVSAGSTDCCRAPACDRKWDSP